jgi:hypothetical protein
MDKQELVHIIKLAIKYDRDLRFITSKYEELQGSDYRDKKKYTNRALTEYGYKPQE